MKIQIDTENKKIKVEDSVNIEELIGNIKKLFPDGEWKEYILETNVTVVWDTYPIIRDRYPTTIPYPSYPWVTCSEGTNTYNIEIS